MKVLGIGAHADDEVIFSGFIRKVISEGGDGAVICFTGNESRKKEFFESCKILKVKPIFLGHPNKGINDLNFKKEVEQLMLFIKDYKPDIIATVSDLDYHPDHKALIKLINYAVEFASHGVKGEAWLVKKVLMFESTNLFPYPDHFINIDKEIKHKEKAMKKYVSQLSAKHKKNYYLKNLKKRAEMRGFQAGCKYAEACIEMKFPIHGNFYCENRTINSIKEFLDKK